VRYTAQVVRRPFALGNGDVTVVGFFQMVFFHLPARDQRIDAVGAAMPERRQMLLRHSVEVRGNLGVARDSRGVTADHQDHVRSAGLHCAQRIAEHVHGRGAAVGILRQPAQRQAELPGQIHRGVRSERKRSHRHALDVLGGDAGVLQRRHDRIAHEGLRGLARLRPPRVGRLADPDDGGVVEHSLRLDAFDVSVWPTPPYSK
jgi:hypothetical protein